MADLKEYIQKNIDKSESMRRQMVQYLLDIHEFNSFEDFKDVISTMVEIEQFQKYYSDMIIERIANVYNRELYPKSDIKEFISKYFLDGIEPGEKYSLYYSIYSNFKNDPSYSFPISEIELKEICYQRLKKFVYLKVNDLSKCSNLYYLCRDYVDSKDHVVLQERAHPQMRQFIDNFPWEYIDSLIRPYGVPTYRRFQPTFTIEPFVEATFEGWNNFWNFLDNYKSTIKNRDRADRFGRYYQFFLRFKKNGYKPVIIPDTEWEKFAIDKLIDEQKWQVVD